MINDWMSSILRDRYDVVRDERDAYRNMQDQFSYQIENLMKVNNAKTCEIEYLNLQLQNKEKEIEDITTAIENISKLLNVK